MAKEIEILFELLEGLDTAKGKLQGFAFEGVKEIRDQYFHHPDNLNDNPNIALLRNHPHPILLPPSHFVLRRTGRKIDLSRKAGEEYRHCARDAIVEWYSNGCDGIGEGDDVRSWFFLSRLRERSELRSSDG